MKVAQSCPTLWDPTNDTVHGILQASILEWVAFPFSRGSFETRSSTFQADFLPAEPQGKPKNTGVSSLFFLQGIFLTQESNQGLLHCRRILYLSGEPPAGKESTCNVGDLGSIPRLGTSPGEGIGYPLQYSWTCERIHL